MSFVNLLIDSLPSEDVIDLYFIMTDLFDIVPNQADANQDWLSSNGDEEIANGKGVPARGTRVNKYGEPK